MQVVVELPCLVTYPQVEVVVADNVEEDHEIGEEDLVHTPPRLEAVQVVLGRFGLEVPRLTGQVGAGRVHALAAGFEELGDRALGQPIDLQVRAFPPQRFSDGKVAAGVAQADGRGDEQGLSFPRTAAGPAHGRRSGTGEVAHEQVDPDWVPHLGEMARPLQRHQVPADSAGQGRALSVGPDQVHVPMDDERGAPHPGQELLETLYAEPRQGLGGVGQHLRCRPEAPAHAVFDRFGGMGLVEALREKELQETGIVKQPEVAVVLRPALVGLVALVEAVAPPFGAVGDEPHRRGDVDELVDSARVDSSGHGGP